MKTKSKILKKKPTIEVITHYATDDTRFIEDYYAVTIRIGGKLVREYGDWYHDKGLEKSEGFVDGFSVDKPNGVKVIRKNKANFDLNKCIIVE